MFNEITRIKGVKCADGWKFIPNREKIDLGTK